MGYSDRFLLGPLGAMTELPATPADDPISAQVLATQAVQESLTGRPTVDVFGYRREWNLPFSWRTETEAAQLVTRWTSPGARLRLLDPNVPNLLSLGGAAGGSLPDSSGRFTPTAGLVAAVAVPAALPGEAAALPSCLAWNVPASTVADLAVDDTTHGRAPVLGRALAGRVYLRGTGSAQVFLRRYDQAGALLGTTLGSSVTLSGSAWSAVTVTLAAGDAAVSVALGVRAASGSARTVYAGGLQLEHAAAPGAWSPGGACPRVVLLGLDHTIRRMGRRHMNLIAREV